jgi:agmatinase
MSKLNQTFENLLCPPGNGVYTVNTAKERKQKIYDLLYPNASSDQEVVDNWKSSFQNISSQKHFLFGIASDCGAGIVRGSNWGPLFLREKMHRDFPELMQKIHDLGDIRVIPHLLHDKYLNEATIKNCQEQLYGKDSENYPVAPLSMAEYFLDQFYEENPDAIIYGLGGDHSVSYPLVKSYLKKQKKKGVNTALIHFDAHTDLLDSRLGIDLCFGTWTYHVLDDLASSDHIIQLGIRSSGKDRNHWENKFQMKQYWSHEILNANLDEFSEKIVDHLKQINVEEIYISFDIDAIDAGYASATGTPEVGGLEPHHAIAIINKLRENFLISGADMVEVAPFVSYPDIEAKSQEPDNTLTSACSILASMMP